MAYQVNPALEGLDLPEYAVAILTLGHDIDKIIDKYMAKGQIFETYILDAIAVKILSRSYETLVKEVNSYSGKTVYALEFIGNRYPMELTATILDLLKPKGVTIGDGYMLRPLKSVCLVLPLKEASTDGDENVENVCNTCAQCGNLKCIMRQVQ